MQIVVCIKETLDPEAPVKDFHLDPTGRRPLAGKVPLVLDSFAGNALELAIQVKERHGGTVTVLALGEPSAEDNLRRALAMTADRAVRIWDPAWEDLDAPACAHILSRAIDCLGRPDLILAGRQSADWENGQVGPMLAEALGYGCVSLAVGLRGVGDAVLVEQETGTGTAVVEAGLPLVLTVTSRESNVPRLPRVRDTMLARRKPIIALAPGALGLDAARLQPTVRLQRLCKVRAAGQCEILTGTGVADQARELVERLREHIITQGGPPGCETY